MSYFLLCFELLPPPPSIYSLSEVHLKVESSFLPVAAVSLTQVISVAAACTSHAVGDSRSQFTKTCVSICAVCETLLRGAIRNKTEKGIATNMQFQLLQSLPLWPFSFPHTAEHISWSMFLTGHIYSLTILCLDIIICVFKDLLRLFPAYLLLLLTPESCAPGATVTRKGWKHLRPGGSAAWWQGQSHQVYGSCELPGISKGRECTTTKQEAPLSWIPTSSRDNRAPEWAEAADLLPKSRSQLQELQHCLCLFLCISPSSILRGMLSGSQVPLRLFPQALEHMKAICILTWLSGFPFPSK